MGEFINAMMAAAQGEGAVLFGGAAVAALSGIFALAVVITAFRISGPAFGGLEPKVPRRRPFGISGSIGYVYRILVREGILQCVWRGVGYGGFCADYYNASLRGCRRIALQKICRLKV